MVTLGGSKMYFPYLRGRQFELIAVRELLEKGLLNENIIPIIEPVKLSSTLTKTLSTFIESRRRIAIIHNPKVGSFILELTKDSPVKELYNAQLLDETIIKAHIINNNSLIEVGELTKRGVSKNEMLTISVERDYLDIYKELYGGEPGRFNLIPDERIFKRTINNNKVLFDDKFNKLSRNVEYKDIDEFFSEDHLFYNEEGYIGFSDYSMVGNEYSESGFAPFAVAIHMVYFDEEKNLRMIHFVSESNDDIQDPGGKFYEAVSKLYEWQRDKTINTFGLNELVNHYHDETYPGLGTVKKLSIMHHIELMSQFLGGDY